MWTYRADNEFYVHEKYGKVPKGWDVKPLSECFNFFPTASFSRSNLTETGDCCYIHYGDIHTRFYVFLDFQKEQLPFVSDDMGKRFAKLQDGDLIMADASEDYDGVGKAVEVTNIEDKQAIAGLHTLHLRCKDNCFIKGFRGYILNNEKVRLGILRIATGIKVYSITKTDLKKILLPQPPESEQIVMAAILSKVDEAITATRNSIKTAEKLQKALIQNLLTGKLKPDGTWRKDDEFYVDEKFGKLPVGWEAKAVGDKSHCNINPNYKFRKGEEYDFIPMEGVNDNFRGIENLETKIIDGGGFTRFKKGDILFAKITPCTENGKVALIEEMNTEVGFASTEFIIFQPKENLDNLFLYYLLSSSPVHRLAVSLMEGTTGRQRVPWKVFRKRIQAAFPKDVCEQRLIASKLRLIEKSSESKQEKIQSLQRLKKSLMQNLLTGKVRLNAEVFDKILSKEKEKVELMEDAAV